MNKALVYEVTLDIGADAALEFDAWLAEHVREMLALPGFRDARILSPENPDAAGASIRRVVQYTLAGRAELERYLSEHAPRMRADGSTRFGEKLKTSRRVLDVDQAMGVVAPALPGIGLMPDVERCRNCGTPLSGRFCAECGQRHHKAVATLRESFDDFAGSHFGFDTKFIHSIVPLLFRPGFLTREYCLGRQERYVKPFRLYLFSSIVFFFLAAFMWPQSDSLKMGDATHPRGSARMSPEEKDETRDQIALALKQIDAKPDEDSAEKRFAKSILEDQLAQLDAPATKAAPVAASKAKPAVSAAVGDSNVNLNVETPGKDTDVAQDPFTSKLMSIKDHPNEFKHQFYQNLPKMMLLFMPLVAMFLKLLYIGSRRLFAEHFIFTLHFHALVFVIMLLVMLANFSAVHVSWLAPLKKESNTVAGWYLALYLFLAMRFFYHQSWLMTGLKFFLLFICYCVAVGITIAAAVALTAVEI
jgi:hypothetical protein